MEAVVVTVRTSSAFSPCQITGFFRIYDQFADPARVGSTGAGVNLSHGVRTSVFVRKSGRARTSVRFNGHPLRRAIVSRSVIDDYLSHESRSSNVLVLHHCRFPVGTGYGTSGAGAASLSLALNEALGNPFSKSAGLRIAHVAEVRAKTGLGTVASVSEGGLAVRVTPGSPGVGEVRKLNVPKSLRVVSASFGPISTTSVLSSRSLRGRVNACSRRLVENLLRKPDEKNFVRLSRNFADCLGLISSRLQRVLGAIDSEGFGGSMMMVGDGAFCLVPDEAAARVSRLMRRAGLVPIISGVSQRGVHLV